MLKRDKLPSSASKAGILATQTFKYSMEADGANTAILDLSTIQTDATNRVMLQTDIRYRIGTDGSASWVSGHEVDFAPPTDGELTYTAM